MKLDIVLGLQWGDEGKGKMVDVLAGNYPIVARFQGGPNAGHSLHFGKTDFVLHTIPSGIFRKGTINIIGNGVVIDPIIFKDECSKLEALNVPVKERLVISKKAHLILPTHKIIDAAQEESKGKDKIGSTHKGIGPTYSDKTGRVGLRVGELTTSNFIEKFKNLKARHIDYLRLFDFKYNAEEHEQEWLEAIEYLKSFKFVDGEYFVNDLLEKKEILAEGAQGSMLDIDFGSYPFVTSSNTIASGACIGLGVSPRKIGDIYGIFKAYCTRVGAGPFPTELFDETGNTLRKIGREFGATTGRDRRCGWLDLVALKYTIMINGVNKLIMMKADVMDDFDIIKIATSYKVNGKETKVNPFDTLSKITPVYTELKGWKTKLSDLTKENEFPQEFKDYIAFIEKEIGVPIKIISIGPDRNQTIVRN
ncbi:MAG: adenylosuccinate synthase [Bacteroidales bacterium]